MPVQLPLQPHISQSSQNKTKPRISRVQFGDGYAMEAPEGLNPFPESWSIVYENLTVAELQSAIAVLKSVAGTDHMTWTSPISPVEQKWRVTADGWGVTPSTGMHYTLSYSVMEWFQ
jgi:phage-related protein